MVVLIFVLLAPYLSRYSHYIAAIDEQLFRLERLQAVAAQLPVLEKEIDAVRAQARARGYLLEESTPSLAAAQIQEQLARMVAIHGGGVRSMQVGRPLEEKGFHRVSVNVSMTSSSEELADLFFDLESRRPLLFLDNVQIRLAHQRTRRGTEQETSGQVELGFDVYAYMERSGE
jgi:general secretion pathway protein M